MREEKAAIDSKINQLQKVLGSIHEVKKELCRSKVMIVGEGCAGKTAFANSIIGEEYKETESTVGINTFMCSVTHAALSKSEWKKCEKIEKEYENARAEHLSFKKDDLAQQESYQIVGKKDAYAVDHQVREDGVDEREEDGAALDHLKVERTNDDINQSSVVKLDKKNYISTCILRIMSRLVLTSWSVSLTMVDKLFSM
jgi:GTPase SAR1 family protein